MKKESIIQIFKTINSICGSYDDCNLCVFKGSCPYSCMEMSYTDNVEQVAEVIKNTMDCEEQNNGKGKI